MAKSGEYIDGTKIRAFREAKRWTQDDLARRMNEIEGKESTTRRKVISQRESAPITRAHYKTLRILAQALEVPEEMLLARPETSEFRRSLNAL